MTSGRCLFLIVLFACSITLHAQFIDNFDKENIEGWYTMTGDGTAQLNFVQNDGYATMVVDGTKDKYNVYWTLIKRDVTSFLDLNKLKIKTTSSELRPKYGCILLPAGLISWSIQTGQLIFIKT